MNYYKYGELNIEHFFTMLNVPIKTKELSLLGEHYTTKDNNLEYKRCLELYSYLGFATHELKMLYFYSKPGELCVDCFRRFVSDPKQGDLEYLYNMMNTWISYYDDRYDVKLDGKIK